MEWYLMVWKKYAQFNGRSRRKEYWMFFLFNTLVGILLSAAGVAVKLGMISAGLYFIYLMAVLVPSLAVSVRRLHDLGKSGWLLLIVLIPIVGPLILLVMMALEGNPGANQYGPNPKLTEQSAAIG
jgi:uncharacterized membrane protein YhaH (DUF805 family)